MRCRVKRGTGFLSLVFLLVILCSCGRGKTTEFDADSGEDAQVPVAEFQDMKLPVPLGLFRLYTSNEEWFYAVSPRYDKEKQMGCWYIYRGRIADEWEAEEYVAREGYNLLTLLADREDNCYLYMQAENGTFFLEKYNVDGELMWHSDYTASQLTDKGERLTDGIITEDGRVILYDYGMGGNAFVFGAEGALQGMFTPNVECLEGIVEGQEGRVYGYCLTGQEPIFADIEDASGSFVCPITPLQVYGGREDGVYLCTGEGLWKYAPETGETERLWLWDDEYVQIDGARVCHISRGSETIDLTYKRPTRMMSWKGDILTFASVGYANSQDYPEKQVVTISRSYYQNFEEYSSHHMEELVRQYNRQSRKYRVVVLLPDEDMISGEARYEFFTDLEMQLMRGEGPDLIEVQTLNVDNLAAKGALEDLTGYYESSDVVGSGDILEQVREAGRVMGRDMVVIPAFRLNTMRSREKVDANDWTPLRFLEMAQGNGGVTYPDTSRHSALWYCMGVSLGGHFVDYERRECYFDSEDFCRVLEGCAGWEAELPPVIRADSKEKVIELLEELSMEQMYTAQTQEWQLQTVSISTMFEVLQHDKKEAYWLGYPGWNGAETQLGIMDGFVMNSASKNKEGAWDFLEFLLSEELQNSIDWGFPARRDSFEDYLTYSYMRKEDAVPEFDYYLDNAQTPVQEDFDVVWEALDRAVYRPAGFYLNDNPIRVILEEETGMYFAGDATLEDTVKKIQNRVTLYLNEM